MSSFRPDPAVATREFEPTPEALRAPFRSEVVAAAVEDPGPEAHELDEGSAADEGSWTREQVETLEREAFERGAESVREEAREEARRLAVARRALETAAARTQELRAGFESASRTPILELAIEIARRWVGEELRAVPERFVAALESALELAREHEPERIFLSPSDLERLGPEGADRLEGGQPEASLALLPDASLEAGEFRIEARTGLVDGRADAVCARLRQALDALWSEESTGTAPAEPDESETDP